MICTACGSNNFDDSKFCGTCGTPLSNFAPPAPSPSPFAQPYADPAAVPPVAPSTGPFAPPEPYPSPFAPPYADPAAAPVAPSTGAFAPPAPSAYDTSASSGAQYPYNDSGYFRAYPTPPQPAAKKKMSGGKLALIILIPLLIIAITVGVLAAIGVFGGGLKKEALQVLKDFYAVQSMDDNGNVQFDMDLSLNISVSALGESMDIRMTGNQKTIYENRALTQCLAVLETEAFGQSTDMVLFIGSDGKYYSITDGITAEVDSLDDALPDTSLLGNGVYEDLTANMIKSASKATDSDGSTTYVITVNGQKLLDLAGFEEILGSLSGEMGDLEGQLDSAEINFENFIYTITLDQDGTLSEASIQMDFSMDIMGITASYSITSEMTYNSFSNVVIDVTPYENNTGNLLGKYNLASMADGGTKFTAEEMTALGMDTSGIYLELYSGNQFAMSLKLDEIGFDEYFEGSYTVSDNTLSLISGGTVTATIDGTKITIDIDGVVMVFEKSNAVSSDFSTIAGTWTEVDLEDDLVISANGTWTWYNGPAKDNSIYLEGVIEIRNGHYFFIEVDLGDQGAVEFDLNAGFCYFDIYEFAKK